MYTKHTLCTCKVQPTLLSRGCGGCGGCLDVILPSKDAAHVGDEPLGGVESQDAHAVVTLQPQLQYENNMHL